MSETIVAKAGGTSNATAEAVQQSLTWAEQSDIFVVSAPGKLAGTGVPKVTDQLLIAHKQYMSVGTIDPELLATVTDRYASIARGLGTTVVSGAWVDNINSRIKEAAHLSEDSVSMLGERLQAEIYEKLGFTLLDPGRAPHDLGSDPDAWRSWLSRAFSKGQRFVLPGNTTKVNKTLATFDRGGSDISGGLTAYGVQADVNLNLTDSCAHSADPKLIPFNRLTPLSHLLYVEGRELGRNGTGLVHPAAMVALMRGNIPTEVRSTFDRSAPATLLDNDTEKAERRRGRVMALSRQKNVIIHTVHEPGMAEATGRLVEFEKGLAEAGIPLIDSQGDGVDGQRYYVEAQYGNIALSALGQLVKPYGEIRTKLDVDLITLVGYDLNTRIIDNLVDMIFNTGIDAKRWQSKRHDFSTGRHSLRLSVDSQQSSRIFDSVHQHFIENDPSARQQS